MNQLEGQIVRIESSQNISMVDINVQGDIFSAVVLETPQHSPLLKKGARLQLLFKETEVSIGKNLSGMISLRNRATGRIHAIEKGEILTKVAISYRDQNIRSIISTHSAERLSLIIGDQVEWLVKSNEMTLGYLE